MCFLEGTLDLVTSSYNLLQFVVYYCATYTVYCIGTVYFFVELRVNIRDK